MLRNYLTVAIRSLTRNWSSTAINVLGLAVGMACCLLIAGYVRYELSYDLNHSHAHRIYRVLRETRGPDGRSRFRDGTSGPLGDAMRADIPEVEKTARMWDHWISVKSEKAHLFRTVAVVDPSFFDIFDFPLLSGSAKEVLQAPGTVLLTEASARQFFGDEDPIGRNIRIKGDFGAGEFVVAGVLKQPPPNTSVRFQVITTHRWSGFHDSNWEDWLTRSWRQTTNYVLLKEGADPEAAEEILRPMVARYLGPETAKTDTYHLESLTRTRLYHGADFGTSTGRIEQLWSYTTISALVLLIACINFVNLTTARSTRRAREVGIRKVTGARRAQLIAQFLGEAVMVALLALIVGLALAQLGQQRFNDLVGLPLEPAWDLVPGAAVVTIVLGLLAGVYPAFYLARFDPITVMKGPAHAGRGGQLRRALVVCQFAASAALVFGTMTVHRQLKYIESRSVGYDKSNIVALWMLNRKPELNRQRDLIKQRLLDHPGAISASGSHGYGILDPMPATLREEGADVEHSFYQIGAEPEFLSTFRIDLIQGRNVRPETYDVLINETALRQMGWDDPIGKQITWKDFPGVGTVVGVVRDFHFQSFRSPIRPLIIYHHWYHSHIDVRIRPDRVQETLGHFRRVWQEFAPEVPFSYKFLDERVHRAYRRDHETAALTTASSGLAIFVSCLGLLGLAAFSTQQRSKEISIRKVLGATTTGLVGLLSREFLLLVVIANLIAVPVGWYFTHDWLQDFTYKAQAWTMDTVQTVAIAVFVAMLTVAAHTIKAAMSEPADVLRNE